MAEAAVKFFLQRLDCLHLQQIEIFTGLEDQIERIKSQLQKIGGFLGDAGSTEGDADFRCWTNQVTDLIRDLEDHVDEFIIQMVQQDESDREALTESFRSSLQIAESHLTDRVSRMAQLDKLTITGKGDGVKEHNKERSFAEEEDQVEASNSAGKEHVKGGEEDSKAQSHEKEGATELYSTTDQASDSSSCVPFRSRYTCLPYYLRSCLIYCSIFPEDYWIPKGKLIRLLVAEGLVQEKAGQLLEDTAEENIHVLVSQGMLEVKDEHPGHGTKLRVSSPYRMLLKENFTNPLANSESSFSHKARRIVTSNLAQIAQNLNNLRPRTLLSFGKQDISEDNWLNFTWAKFLQVLDLEDGGVKSLPDEVGNMIHLTYLGLKHNDLEELPPRLGKLQALQTLDIRWCGYLAAVSPEILNLVRLRHLKMFKNIGVSGIKLPEGIGRLRNLLTLTGVHPGNGIAEELGKLTQLRRLGVMDVAEENVNELYASIMKMQGLRSLSLEPKCSFDKERLVLLDSFCPPPLLQKLRLEGRLDRIPNWLGSMESLTKLRLGFSHLSESPMLVLQLLPNLKYLTLWHAYEAKQFGKEFCKAGGFPKLEVLSIASRDLEEWTELEEGALPSLQYLHFHNCLHLRMLPEGLQFVTSLKQLDLLPLLDDHVERLKPDSGEENYKIRHIPKIRFFPMSVVSQMSDIRPGTSEEEMHEA